MADGIGRAPGGADGWAAELAGVVKRFPKPFSYRRLLRLAPRGDAVVLDGLSLRLRPGEILGLAGRNGSGKSTLLRLMAGLLVPDGGRVRILGREAAHGASPGGDVGLVLPNERSFFWRLTLRRNLAFFALLNNLDGREASRRAEEAAEEVGLSDALDRPFRELSDGMKQRAALARGLLTRPRLLLVDEATRSLDPAGRRIVHGLLREHAREHRGALLLVTHDLGELETLCDRAALLDGGRLALEGTWAEVGPALRAALEEGTP